MKTLNLVQGSPEWHAHRGSHFNASDAPAMLGVSPYKSRAVLVREYATGVTKEIEPGTQALFDAGHDAEAKARPLAEAIIGEELYPCVGAEGKLSASFDGLTLFNDTAFEHKLLNEALRAAMTPDCTGADLPEVYQVQMEQQCAVADALRVLFMATQWEGERLVEKRTCWYTPNAALRSRILAGWTQFESDVTNYKPTPEAAPEVVGRAPDSLPALRIDLVGSVTASNLSEYRERAIAVFRGINTDLQTDQDFANAAEAVKFCDDVETRLRAAKEHALGQTKSIDELFRAIDSISSEARAKRLELEKLVAARKESIRTEIVVTARDAYSAHVEAMKVDTGGPWIALAAPDFAGAIKGKRTVTSMRDAVDAVLANAKIAASESARKIRAALACLDLESIGFEHLFADRISFISRPIEDVQTIARARIAAHNKREEERREQERERIRAEESEKLQAAALAAAAAAHPPAPPVEVQLAPPVPEAPKTAAVSGGFALSAPASATPATPATTTLSTQAPAAAAARIKLGDINALIAPLSINAEGLGQLGFHPVGTERAAKLYAAADFPAICNRIVSIVNAARERGTGPATIAA